MVIFTAFGVKRFRQYTNIKNSDITIGIIFMWIFTCSKMPLTHKIHMPGKGFI
jgi:hypothetical protein